MILRFTIGGRQEALRSFEYHHAEFRHEVVVLSIPRTVANARRFASGTPMSVEWGASPTKKNLFFGYVSHIDPEYDISERANGAERSLSVVCMGPSYLMQDGGFLTAKSTPPSTIARQIGEKYRFDTTHVQAHPRIFSLVAQAGRSAFTFLNDLAQECGYTHYSRGLALYFHERLSALSTLGAPPVLAPRLQGGGLLKFDSSIGDATATGGVTARRLVHGVNPRTAQVFAAKNQGNVRRPLLGRERITPRFSVGETTMVLDSYADASQSLAAQEGNNELGIQARVHSLGEYRMFVGGAVSIQGIDTVNDGLWYVTDVTHHIYAPDKYETRATLGRDAFTGVVLPRRAERSRARGARLLNSQWVLA